MDLKDIEETRDLPLTLTAINQFRRLLDVMEQFIRDSQQEEQESHE